MTGVVVGVLCIPTARSPMRLPLVIEACTEVYTVASLGRVLRFTPWLQRVLRFTPWLPWGVY